MRTVALALFTIATAFAAGGETRLLRMPDVSERHVAFVYANDVWVAPRDGGDARRLTTFEGAETDPHFSPDGDWIAFSGQYDGNTDVYVVPVAGGSPKRLTWHPGPDIVRGWTVDGGRVLFASGRDNAPLPIPRFWTIGVEGGLPEALPIPRIDEGAYSPDGTRLAYQKITQWESEFRNYRGGQSNPVRIIDLDTLEVTKLPWGPERTNDIDPVWVDGKVLFLSDRDYAHNVWSYDLATGALEQRTFFEEFDCKSLEAGPGLVVFENGGRLYTLDPEAGEPQRLSITVRGDFPWARPHWEEVGERIARAAISPTGKRALFEARGEIFTLPAEKGDIRNLTGAPGSAERAPAWSPEGDRVAWFSDASGEYALVVADQFGEIETTIEIPGATYFYDTTWSPDGASIAFTDADRVVWIAEVESGELTRVDDEGSAHPVRVVRPTWSPDSRWLAYTKRLSNQYPAIFVYDTESSKSHQITDGLSASYEPVWDEGGEYLWFKASTDFGPNLGWLDMSSYPFETNYALYLVVLSKEAEHPFAPESDDEEVKEDDEDGDDEEKSAKDEGGEKKAEKKDEPKVVIDFDDLHQRIVAVDLPARPYANLASGPEGVLFFGEAIENAPGLSVKSFSVEKREAEPFMEGALGFIVSHDRKKLLYYAPGGTWGILDAKGKGELGKGKLPTGEMRALIDPPAEWRQIFREAVRFQRDYFYVENVHGLDLAWAEETYGAWLPHVRHRADLTYLLDILGGETAIGHSFTGGGDTPSVERVPVGLLGADLELDEESGRYRIARIYDGESWNPGVAAPLAGPGIDVSEGDYLLAIDGVELAAGMNPYAPLDSKAGKQVRLEVSAEPQDDEPRRVTVVPVPDETQLRTWEWVESRRRMVDELSDGQLAYVWLPNTGGAGYTFFNRFYFAQRDKKGAVLDERFNGGGSIADYIVDMSARELLGYFNNPIGDKQPWTAPNAAIWGPKVMIVNDAAGSGGDMLPYMFKKRGVGPLVGTRTWGGLVGIWDVPGLVDGGFITAPRGGFFTTEGEWAVENEGVAPDYVVENEPKAVAAGRDPQLEKAVELALQLRESEGVELKPQPEDPVRVRRPGASE